MRCEACYKTEVIRVQPTWFPRIDIKFKLTHPDAKLPCKSSPERDDPYVGDSGYDIFCVEDKFIFPYSSNVVETGIQLAYITPGFWYRIEARSGISFKHGCIPHFGIIDNPYRGIQSIKIYNLSSTPYEIKKGDKIAQLVIYPLIVANIEKSDTVSETHRGEGRLGSTGR